MKLLIAVLLLWALLTCGWSVVEVGQVIVSWVATHVAVTIR